MKTIIKMSLFLLCIILFYSCEKQIDTSDSEIYQGKGKIVGYLKCSDGERDNTLFGIFIISNNKDSILSFNITSSIHNLDTDQVDYGVHFFKGDSVLFDYRYTNAEEKKRYDCPPSTMLNPTFYAIDNFSQVIVTDITNISVYPLNVNITNITVLVKVITTNRVVPLKFIKK
jgi:hypothetical protein